MIHCTREVYEAIFGKVLRFGLLAAASIGQISLATIQEYIRNQGFP
jgi:hypothetical protein